MKTIWTGALEMWMELKTSPPRRFEHCRPSIIIPPGDYVPVYPCMHSPGAIVVQDVFRDVRRTWGEVYSDDA